MNSNIIETTNFKESILFLLIHTLNSNKHYLPLKWFSLYNYLIWQSCLYIILYIGNESNLEYFNKKNHSLVLFCTHNKEKYTNKCKYINHSLGHFPFPYCQAGQIELGQMSNDRQRCEQQRVRNFRIIVSPRQVPSLEKRPAFGEKTGEVG